MDSVILSSDGGFGEVGKPIVRGGEEVALYIRLQESTTLDNGVCEQPLGLQVVARGLFLLPPSKVQATSRFINWACNEEGDSHIPARR